MNDLYGHSVGDELLIAVAERLTAALRSGDTLARMSGDEFVILCEDLDEAAEVDVIAARIGAAVSAAPFILPGAEAQVTASVGIAFSGRGDQLSEQLLQDADAAMYQAKRKGGARHQVIDLREQHLADERAGLERDLRGAAARGELRTEYQPIVDTTDGRITGVEALAALGAPHPWSGDADRARAHSPSSPASSSTSDGGSSNGPAPTATVGSVDGPTTSRCRSTSPPTSSCLPTSRRPSPTVLVRNRHRPARS